MVNKRQKQLILHIGKRDQSYTQSKLADLISSNKKTTSYNLTQLVKHGFIKRINLGRENNYKLTGKGKNYAKSKLLTLSETPRDSKCMVDRAHDLRIRCKIERKPDVWANACEYKVVPMQNWNKYIRHLDGVTIEASGSSIIYRIDEIFDSDPQLALDRAFELVKNVNTYLMNENRELVLGEPECLAVVFYQHHGLQKDPFAVWCVKNNIHARYKDVRVDASDGPELEFENAFQGQEFAQRYLEYVRDVATGEIKREDLSHKNLGGLGVKLDELIPHLGAMVDAQNTISQSVGQIVTGNLSVHQHNERIWAEMLKIQREFMQEIERLKSEMKLSFRVRQFVNRLFGRAPPSPPQVDDGVGLGSSRDSPDQGGKDD